MKSEPEGNNLIMNSNEVARGPHLVHREDHEFAQLLLSGESGAWDRLYNEFRKKLDIYINRKYPEVFSTIVIEEIFDGVCNRLIDNDYKALREYRGECSFSAYVTKATDWEIKDWLRKHSEELMNETIDTIGQDDKTPKDVAATHSLDAISEREEIPETVETLNDDLRFAFLLRYYDYFGFPLDQIRLLAKKTNVTIGSITERLIRFLDPVGEDVLRSQREKQLSFQERLQKVCGKITN